MLSSFISQLVFISALLLQPNACAASPSPVIGLNVKGKNDHRYVRHPPITGIKRHEHKRIVDPESYLAKRNVTTVGANVNSTVTVNQQNSNSDSNSNSNSNGNTGQDLTTITGLNSNPPDPNNPTVIFTTTFLSLQSSNPITSPFDLVSSDGLSQSQANTVNQAMSDYICDVPDNAANFAYAVISGNLAQATTIINQDYNCGMIDDYTWDTLGSAVNGTLLTC
jgi:hypothetical protein